MEGEVNKQQLTGKKRTKKCHGNRKLQRFRKKWRSRGMNDRAIEMLLLIKNASNSMEQDTQQEQRDKEENEDEGENGIDDSNTTNAEIVIDMSMFFEDQVR